MKKPINQRLVVGGVILRESKILIVQRSSNEETYPDLWEVPSGKKEPLENAIDAVLREVKEETGLSSSIIDIINTFNFSVEKQDEIRDVTQINFLLKINDNCEIKLSEEHQNYAWITKGELNKYNLSKETKETLSKAFNKKSL